MVPFTFVMPTNVAAAFESCAPTLAKCVAGHATLTLGGGTVLAGRWAHRRSTELDFFVSADPAGIPALIARAATALESLSDVEALVARSRFLTFVCRRTEVSLFSSPPLTNAQAVEREPSTGVLLEPTEEILARKIHGRMLGSGDLVARDFYDLCVASRLAPAAYASARSVVSDEDVRDILAELCDPPAGGKPLLDPAYPDLAGNLWSHTRALLGAARDLRGRGL